MNTSNLPNFYIHSVSFAQNEHLNLLQLGRDLSSPGFSYPQYHNTYSIYFIKSGKGTVETMGKKYILTKNDAFIIRPNELTIQTADSKEPWELYFFTFNGSVAAEVLNRTVFKYGAVSTTLKENRLHKDILDATLYLNNNSHSILATFEYLFKFISYFDIYKTIPELQKEQTEQKYVSEIKKYIQTNYLNEIKISDIANQLNINRSHLYRIFKKEIGVGVEDYVANIRITHAKSLLCDSLLPVTQISALVGYKTYTAFFKKFKNLTGITPLEYRKTHNKK
ncbi:MAG: AraC family transcriptional regulator [Ruminococcaceae bacterium]|nr:AraC family transcriptional regulator [Oscillospiraceae bacterium]